MQNVVLLGDLGQKFGEYWSTAAAYVSDVFKHIACQRPTFRHYLIECREKGLDLSIERAGEFITDAEELLLSLGEDDLALALIPAGSGTGIGATIAEAIASFFTKEGLRQFAIHTARQIAISLAIHAITEWLAPGPNVDESVEGYLFSGALNNVKEGIPIPVLYGRLMVGGAVINNSYTDFPIKHFQNEQGYENIWLDPLPNYNSQEYGQGTGGGI